LTLYEHKVVGVAENVAAAMTIAMREPIDLALCDIRLANGDSGVEAAARLAKFGIPCPAQTDNPMVVGYMAKPFPTAALGRAVIAAHAVAHGEEPHTMPTGMQLYPH
jgi:CheY-like chemotaxis protein